MNWAHLPQDGGLYDQSPKLLDRFQAIMAAEAREEAKRQKEEEAKRNRRGPRVAGSRGR